jgi:hypothetical protein
MKKADTGDAAAGEEQDGAEWPAVGSERRPTVRGGGRLGVARPAVARVGAHGAAMWQR